MERNTTPRAGSEGTSQVSSPPFNYVKANRSKRLKRLRTRGTIFTTFASARRTLASGFRTMFGNSMRMSTSWLARWRATKASTRMPTASVTPERHIPGLTKTTYYWNWADIPVPAAEAFWHGWADGMSRRCSSDMADLHSKLGAMYNRKYYRFGLTLGERGVVARDAMAYFVERCKEEAYPQRDPSKFDPYDDIRRS